MIQGLRAFSHSLIGEGWTSDLGLPPAPALGPVRSISTPSSSSSWSLASRAREQESPTPNEDEDGDEDEDEDEDGIEVGAGGTLSRDLGPRAASGLGRQVS